MVHETALFAGRQARRSRTVARCLRPGRVCGTQFAALRRAGSSVGDFRSAGVSPAVFGPLRDKIAGQRPALRTAASEGAVSAYPQISNFKFRLSRPEERVSIKTRCFPAQPIENKQPTRATSDNFSRHSRAVFPNFYPTIVASRIVRNSLKTNDRCARYPTIFRGGTGCS